MPGRTRSSGPPLLAGWGGVCGGRVCVSGRSKHLRKEKEMPRAYPPPPQPRHEHWGKRSWGKRRAKEAVLLGEEGTGEVANKA